MSKKGFIGPYSLLKINKCKLFKCNPEVHRILGVIHCISWIVVIFTGNGLRNPFSDNLIK